MTMSLCVCRIADLFPFDVFFPPDLIKIKMKKTGHLLSVLFMPAIDSGHGGHRIVDVAFVQLFHVFYLFIFIVFPFFFLWFLLCFFCFYVLFFTFFSQTFSTLQAFPHRLRTCFFSDFYTIAYKLSRPFSCLF